MICFKIYRELGWKAKTKFEEGLEKTVKWYLDHQDWLEKKVKDLEEFWQKVYRK